jgi:hypothetical protein
MTTTFANGDRVKVFGLLGVATVVDAAVRGHDGAVIVVEFVRKDRNAWRGVRVQRFPVKTELCSRAE